MALNASHFPIPAILSRGKDKSKLILDEDVVPLAQLKKSQYGQLVSINYLSEFESVAFSLIELQDDSRFKGLVQKFFACFSSPKPWLTCEHNATAWVFLCF